MECELHLEERIKIQAEELNRLGVMTADLTRQCIVFDQKFKMTEEKLGIFLYAKESIDKFLYTNEYQIAKINSMSEAIEKISIKLENLEKVTGKFENIDKISYRIDVLERWKNILFGAAIVVGPILSFLTSVLYKYL